MGQGWSSWYRVETAEDARKVIRDSAGALYVVAGIQALASILLGGWFLLEAALLAGLGFWLHRGKGRVAATILLVLAASSIGATAMARFGGGRGGRNIVLAIVVLWAAVRAVQATYKFPGLARAAHTSETAS